MQQIVKTALGPVLLAGAVCFVPSGAVLARTLMVGEGYEFARPSEAAQVAEDGDVVRIQAGIYAGDVAAWRASDLLIQGVGGPVELRANGRSAEGKAIWVIKGDDVVVEGITFADARVADQNGAGIRSEGCNLTIRASVFRNNEMGILTGNGPECSLSISFSEFEGLRDGGERQGLSHNIYVGRLGRFDLRASYVHGGYIGHQVKSRAAQSTIAYNRITDEDDSQSSYLIDLPNGGSALIIGNVLHQNERTENYSLISFGGEGAREESSLAVLNNTMMNDRSSGVFVNNHASGAARVANNRIYGIGPVLEGAGEETNNIVTRGLPEWDDSPQMQLVPPVGERDSAVSLLYPWPDFEYVHPRDMRLRPENGTPDVGAFEAPGG